MVQYRFNWDHISAIARLRRTGLCFRLYDSSVNEPWNSSKPLTPTCNGRCLFCGTVPSRNHVVRDYVDSTEGRIVIKRLPAYAQEINPVEYLWTWAKRHGLANYCTDTLDELHHGAHAKLKSAQRQSSIVEPCWAQAKLLECHNVM